MSDGNEPTPEGMSENAIPATYRRAPRTERFIVTGVIVGAIVGFLLGLFLPAGTSVGRGTAGLLLAMAGALVGGLITGAQAAYLDYVSGRSADRQRDALAAPASGLLFDAEADAPPTRADAAPASGVTEPGVTEPAPDPSDPAEASADDPSDDEGTADAPR